MNIFKLAVPFFVVLNFCTNKLPIENADELAARIVNSLKVNNTNDFEQLLITYEEYEKFIVPEFKKQSKNKIPELMIEEGKEFYRNKNNILLLKKIFAEILKAGRSLGIQDWSKVKFVEFKPVQNITSQPGIEKAIYLLGHIIIEFNNTKFCIYNVSMRKIGEGYKLNLFFGISKYDPNILQITNTPF